MNLINIIEYEKGLNEIVDFALKRKLVPIFGAGFTAGCQACEGVVPNSSTAIKTMIDLVVNAQPNLFSKESLSSLDFFEISDLFFEYVSLEDRALYFECNFTSVKLFPQQVEFLRDIKWPYAYTLNVDDGIEKNSDFTPILPYHKVRRPHTSKRILYKLHGDAGYESVYKDDCDNNIIFSQSQYLQALTNEENSDIYKALLSDFSQKNILFIGCSLQKEQDLKYVYEKSIEYSGETNKYILRKDTPNLIEQQKLKMHGINSIIIVNDYEQFYGDFVRKYRESEEQVRQELFEFINPTVKEYTDKSNSLKLISGANIFLTNNNRFEKGALHVLRDIERDIINNLPNNNCIILKGRRFSGKTFILCSLIQRFKNMDVFYFPSSIFMDEEVIEKLILESNNSLFLFDSNSITQDVYGLIIKYTEYIKEHNIKMVFAVNSNDNFLLGKFNGRLIEVKSSFRKKEIMQNEKAADSFGLARRKLGHTNIDYIMVLKRDQNISLPFEMSSKSKFDLAEQSVLLALCALDKLYYSDLIALDLSKNRINLFCAKAEPFIEVVPTSVNESTRHSTTKLVHNSKIGLVELLKQFSDRQISDGINNLVRKFKPDRSRKRLYIEVILFDTLNQIFSGREKFHEVIPEIYKNLQPLLKDDLHYWLQRAKSIYRTSSNIIDLDEAYSYAKKVYIDGNYDLASKAALTIALISCAISEKKADEEKLGFYEEAITYAHESVFAKFYHLNPNYLESELLIGQNTSSERRIILACEFVQKRSSNIDYITKSKEIIKKFDIMKNNKIH
ncbi:SIR2 family protein [Lachnospiraceae bacterium 54-53]